MSWRTNCNHRFVYQIISHNFASFSVVHFGWSVQRKVAFKTGMAHIDANCWQSGQGIKGTHYFPSNLNCFGVILLWLFCLFVKYVTKSLAAVNLEKQLYSKLSVFRNLKPVISVNGLNKIFKCFCGSVLFSSCYCLRICADISLVWEIKMDMMLQSVQSKKISRKWGANFHAIGFEMSTLVFKTYFLCFILWICECLLFGRWFFWFVFFRNETEIVTLGFQKGLQCVFVLGANKH